jgi:carboxyl-terminal processing protease
VDDAVVQDDGKPDPRFTATAEQLKKDGVKDFQLQYAVNSIARLAKVQQASLTPKRAGTR